MPLAEVHARRKKALDVRTIASRTIASRTIASRRSPPRRVSLATTLSRSPEINDPRLSNNPLQTLLRLFHVSTKNCSLYSTDVSPPKIRGPAAWSAI
jgi:hypothetical protein